MPAPSQEHVRTAYVGQTCIGRIVVIGDTFHAETNNGRSLGSFASQREAADALSAAHGTQPTNA